MKYAKNFNTVTNLLVGWGMKKEGAMSVSIDPAILKERWLGAAKDAKTGDGEHKTLNAAPGPSKSGKKLPAKWPVAELSEPCLDCVLNYMTYGLSNCKSAFTFGGMKLTASGVVECVRDGMVRPLKAKPFSFKMRCSLNEKSRKHPPINNRLKSIRLQYFSFFLRVGGVCGFSDLRKTPV